MEETISQYIELVLQREPAAGEAEGWAVLIDNGQMTSDQVLQSIIDSVEATTDVYPVILAYQAIFGRVPDAGGLDYWVNVYRGIQDLDDPNTTTVNEAMVELLHAFVDPALTPEFADRFGPNPTADQFVIASYTNVLNREPDAGGQLYWTNRYNEIHAEVEAANPDWTAEQVNVETRAQILEQFVSSVEYATSAGAAIDGFLTAAAQGEDGAYDGTLWSFSGDTFTLTTDADNYAGTDGNDTFNAPLSSGAGGLVAQQTLQGFDTLDGGEGHDTLNAALNGFDALFGAHDPSISNIEQYNLTVREEGADGGLDLANASGYEVLQNIDSRGDLFLENVNVSESGDAPVIALTNVRGDTEVTYDDEVDSVSVQNVTANKVGLHDNDADLRIDVDNGRIETLNLTVSNGVYLDLEGDAARIENLNISGSGILELEGRNEFLYLENLNSTEYTGDLVLDISGSGYLENVLTGDGSDAITAAAANFSEDTTPPATTVDLGLGDNRLTLVDSFETEPDGVYSGGGLIDAEELSALDFTLGPISNVQTLELDGVYIDGDASLALEGVGGLETLEFFDFDNDGYDLTIDGAPENLTINATNYDVEDASFEMDGGLLTVDGVVNLVMNAGDDIHLDGGLQGDLLETLEMNAGDDITLEGGAGLNALTSINVDALGTSPDIGVSSNARVDLTVPGNLGDDPELESLTTVNVTAAGDAILNLTGRAGAAAIAGVRQVEQFVVNVGNVGLQQGEIIFASGDLTGGAIVTDYSESGGLFQPSRDDGSARDVAADLDASPDLSASVPNILGFPVGNTVTVEWADFGDKEQLTVLSTNVTNGTLSSPTGGTTTLVTAGVTPEDMVEGEGFEALETVTVASGDDAYVNLTDVYGAVALDVTAGNAAGNNAYINLYNTEVTSVTAAAYHVDIDTAGDTVGNGSLTTITVMSATANITLEDNMSSFETLDVTGVSTNLVVDTSAAGFEVDDGMYVEYLLGATEVVNFTGNEVREVYAFDGTDIGDVIITDFTAGADPISGDRLDLSEFGITGQAGLIFTQVGANLEITDLGADDFAGTITLIGVNAADIGFNIIYA